MKADERMTGRRNERAEAREELVGLHDAVRLFADGVTQLVDDLAAARDGKPLEAERSSGTILAAAGGGWRVPSVKELLTIVDETRVNPASDPEVFPGVPTFDESHELSFWSASAQGGDFFAGFEDERWFVRFYFGETWSTQFPRTTVTLEDEIFVRCVR